MEEKEKIIIYQKLSNNVINKLKSIGFVCNNDEGEYHLNINQKIPDIKSGKIYTSKLRTTIKGINNISSYCKKDSNWPYKNMEFLSMFPLW